MIVTRFAPSPTGFLHIGHAYSALTAWQAACDNGGKFLLRIEDIDLIRCRAEFEQAIFEDLSWLGIGWERPVRRQSQHFKDYTGAIQHLELKGLVYPCFCTRQEIATEIARAAAAPHTDESAGDRYPGTCRSLSATVRAERIAEGNAYALRLHCEKALASIGAQDLSFEELGSGPEGQTGYQLAHPERIGDIVLARKELPTSYHLAVVVDDALQGITLVTRGQDLFTATDIQRLLQALLDLPQPRYLHHRLILNRDGKKFSKRDGAVTLRSLRSSGASREEIRRMIGM
jgi:glutamyl-Q tRNA(Asp) synthetase